MHLEMNDFCTISQYNKWHPDTTMDFKFGKACRVVINGPDSDGDIIFKVMWDETCTFEWYIGFQSIMVLRWLDDDKDVKFMLDGTKELRNDSGYMQKIIDYLKNWDRIILSIFRSTIQPEAWRPSTKMT